MGLFSFYTGVVYNDVFAKALNIFGSSWNVNVPQDYVWKEKEVMLDPKNCYIDHPYPIGVDPVWQVCVASLKRIISLGL